MQAMAEDLGDQDKAKQIQDQLNELEERAEALDRQRTKNISAIRYVTEPRAPILNAQTLPQSSGQSVALHAQRWLHVAPGSGLRASLPPSTAH